MNIKASKWVGGGVVGGWVAAGFMGWVGSCRVHGVGGGGVGSCRVHGVGGCGGMGGGGVHGGLGGWRVHGVGAYTHPPMNSYNAKTFHFMNTHPPIKHIQSHSVSIHVLWMVHGVGGWWWWDGLRVHGVGAYTHPPIKVYNVKILIL